MAAKREPVMIFLRPRDMVDRVRVSRDERDFDRRRNQPCGGGVRIIRKKLGE